MSPHHPRRRHALAAIAAWPLVTRAEPRLCSQGRRQSPIDVVETQHASGPTLRFDWHASALRIVHDGHTVRVRSEPGSRLWIGPLAHTLQQFHFHLPGGDRLHGEEFPLGLHFPHKSPSGQLVTVVLLMREGAAHPLLERLLPLMPRPGAGERVDASVRIDPSAWLPPARGYYRYSGSLTGAPCTEGVDWIVMKSAGSVSTAQLTALRALVAPNVRAPQPRYGRAILSVD